MNLVCLICTEIFNASADVFSTPCGHLFHNQCLNQWVERSKSCPQCRFGFTHRQSSHKVYFNIGNTDTSFTDFGVLQQANDDLKLQINEKSKQIKELKSKSVSDADVMLRLNDKYRGAQEKIRASQFLVDALREQIRLLELEVKRNKGLQADLNKANAKLEAVNVVQEVLDGTAKDAEEIINREMNIKTLAVLVATLKRELVASESRRKELSTYLENVQLGSKKCENDVKTWKRHAEVLKNSNEKLRAEINQLKMLENPQSNENNSNASNVQTPVQTETRKRISIIKRPIEINSPDAASPPVHEKVRHIEESESPYLQIKSSSVGLAPLRLKGPAHLKNGPGPSKNTIVIFNRPRLFADSSTPRLPGNGSTALNGLGTSERRAFDINIDSIRKFKKKSRN